MRALLTGILAAAALCGISTAQNAAAQGQQSPATAQSGKPEQPGGTSSRIAPGSVIPVLLSRTIDAKKVKVGDQVEAKVTQDLKADGEVIIPKDTKVLGRVTQAQARTKEQKESQVGITFDHALKKNGDDLPLSMSIQAVIATPAENADNNGAGGGAGRPYSSSAGGMSQGSSGGRGSGATTNAVSAAPPPPAGGEEPTDTPAGANARSAITGDTQGVVGIPNLNLSTAADTSRGSVLSSGKNNVKLESGTLMLLRVNQ
jgi:hypothetical protein